MKIKKIEIEASKTAINPTLLIKVTLEFERDEEAPISIAGRLLTSDNKVVALFNENQVRQDENFSLHILASDKLAAHKDHPLYRHKSANTFYTEMDAVISSKSIDHIEQLKDKRNGEVKFYLDIVVKYWELSVELDNLHAEKLKQLTQNPFSFVRIKKEYLEYNIAQSIWSKEYAPVLGIGRFMIIELEIPKDKQVPELWRTLYKQLIHNLSDMEKCLREGDWKKTMFFARKFYENAKIGDKKPAHKKFKDDFNKVLIKNQHSDEGIQNFYDGIWKFFDFLSKYIHDQTVDGQIASSPIAEKEDAYLAYALALGLLNFIGKKINTD